MRGVGPSLAALLNDLERQQSPMLAVSLRQPEVRIAAMGGRILCIEIGGVRAPFAVQPERRDEIRAALGQVQAARRDGRGTDAVPDSMRVVRAAIADGLAEALRRVDRLQIPRDAWNIRGMNAPSEPSSMRGETIAQLRAMLEGAETPRKEQKLMMNLRAIVQSINKCVALGIVDIVEGGLLAIETPRAYPEDFLGLLGAKSKDLFTDDITKLIEKFFAESKGLPTDGPPRFDTWSAEIEPTKTTPRITHYFRRSGQRIYVFVAIGDINYTMFRSQTSMAATELDKQAITG